MPNGLIIIAVCNLQQQRCLLPSGKQEDRTVRRLERIPTSAMCLRKDAALMNEHLTIQPHLALRSLQNFHGWQLVQVLDSIVAARGEIAGVAQQSEWSRHCRENEIRAL